MSDYDPMRDLRTAHPGAEVIQVIRTTLELKGDGKRTALRRLTQYWTLDGELLATVDPYPEASS